MVQCLLAPNPLLWPFVLSFQVQPGTLSESNLPTLTVAEATLGSFPNPAPQRKGPWIQVWDLPTLPGYDTLSEQYGAGRGAGRNSWAFPSLAFFAADPTGPALGPSQPGNPGSITTSPGPESIPRVSEALLKAGQTGAGLVSLAYRSSCHLVLPSGFWAGSIYLAAGWPVQAGPCLASPGHPHLSSPVAGPVSPPSKM